MGGKAAKRWKASFILSQWQTEQDQSTNVQQNQINNISRYKKKM